MKINQGQSRIQEHCCAATPAALAAKQGRREGTYDFGFGDETHGFGPAVSNGRIIESSRRRRIYRDRIRFIKL